MTSGVLRIEGAPVETLFIHPPELLSSSYIGLALESQAYYAREDRVQPQPQVGTGSKKRKRKQKKQVHVLNNKEILAEKRHQVASSFLLEAHDAFMNHKAAQAKLKSLVDSHSRTSKWELKAEVLVAFVRLSETFQAPFYEINFPSRDESSVKSFQLFNSVVKADSSVEELADCSDCSYVLPKGSQFLMSDFSQIHCILPETSADGYNLILIDPPWENKSVHRRSEYQTLPNKHLLSLPFQRLTHPEGALVGLWMTNREKLYQFVERELFPAWGLVPVGIWYWLKITKEGSMVSPLDLNHHRPYECLLLAKVSSEEQALVPQQRVLISMPGEHSRKPPVGLLLEEFCPGPRPARALELFARELYANWTCWGNEPLRFQSRQYFVSKEIK